MKTLADFKRLARPGSVWRCENVRLPRVSGERRITQGKGVLRYDGTKADGSTFTNGRLELPRAADLRFEGDSVHFLEGGSVKYTWTLVAEAVECSECSEPVDSDDGRSGYGMCASCLHNALRSGWEPGGES